MLNPEIVESGERLLGAVLRNLMLRAMARWEIPQEVGKYGNGHGQSGFAWENATL